MDVEAMDEQEARQRLLEGGYFVALGVPPGVEFGIDLKSYTTGPQFKGVKMIPPGLHFAHFGSGEGEKQGIFFRSWAGSVAATQWDASAEDLVDAQTCLPDGAMRALRESVLRLEMDANLGPHPFEQLAAWLNLTNCITDSVLERCGVPVGAKVLAGSSAAEPGEPGSEPIDAVVDAGDGGAGQAKGNRGKRSKSGGAAATGSGTEIVPHFPHIGRVARYSEVPGRPPAGVRNGNGDGNGDGNGSGNNDTTPEGVTKQHMDGSDSLRRWIASDFGGSWMELLGELQLSFVLFVSLSSLQGFRHWQALSALLCRCGDALRTDPALFTAFIRMLHAHLKLVPEDFFEVELSKDNFLVPCLSALLQNVLPDESLAPALLDAGKRLLKFLQQRFGLFSSGGPARYGPAPAAVAAGAVDAMADDDDDDDEDARSKDRGAGEEEDEALSVSGGLSLMHLELSEEDHPAVVPYEEVVRALGEGALGLDGSITNPRPQDSGSLNGKHGQESSASAVAYPPSAIDASHSTQRAATKSTSSAAGGGQGQGQGQGRQGNRGVRAGPATGRGGGGGDDDGEEEETGRVPTSRSDVGGNLSTPSLEHSRRWEDIDRLLVAAAPNNNPNPNPSSSSFISSNATNSAPSAPLAEAAVGRGQGSSVSPPRSVAVPSPSAVPPPSAAVASVAKKYPLLFAATRRNEDLMMTAARLVASHEEEEEEGRDAEVAREAIAFLEEEVAASEDGGASIWQASCGMKS
eukprot:g7483.t1